MVYIEICVREMSLIFDCVNTTAIKSQNLAVSEVFLVHIAIINKSLTETKQLT